MKNDIIEKRVILLAQYIIDSKDTVRGAAKKFGVSKSTVHTDVTLKNGRKSRTRSSWKYWNKEGFSSREKSSCEVGIGNKIKL